MNLRLVFLFALALTLFGSTRFATAQVASLSQIKRANAPADFKSAIEQGDLRFVAVNGIASGMVPGTDQYGVDSTLIKKHGTRTILGTSDCADLELNGMAWKYATSYNHMLLNYLRKKSSKS